MRIRPDSVFFIILLSSLGGITPLSIDMGLPALRDIGRSLETSPASTALTLSLFLVGFAFGPVVLGPLSDRYGRRPVLLAGCGLFAMAGLGCAFAPSLPVLLAWRLFQGIGAGAGSTLSLAIVRDLFDGASARARLSYVATVGSIAPMIAPTLGAIVLAWLGWRAIYGFLAAAGVLLFITVHLFFAESHLRLDSTALRPSRLAANYARIFRNRSCLGHTLVAALNFGCMFSYVASSPLVMMAVLGLSPATYGWTFAAGALGIMAGAFLNGRLNTRGFLPRTLLSFGLGLSLFSALGLLANTYFGEPFIAIILPLLVVNTFSVGFIGPNATQGIMHPMPDIAGVASAVLGSARMLTGALAAVIVSFLFDGRTTQAMALSMTVFSLASTLAYLTLVRPAGRVADRAPVTVEPEFGP